MFLFVRVLIVSYEREKERDESIYVRGLRRNGTNCLLHTRSYVFLKYFLIIITARLKHLILAIRVV